MFVKKLADMFRKRPLLMNMATFGTAYVSASSSNQIIEKYLLDDKKSIDIRNIVNHGLIGYCCMGPVLYSWFQLFNKVLPVVSKRNIIIKVFVDLAICSPVTISMYFTSMSILEGKEDIFYELKHKFQKAISCNICFWVPAQVISYRYIPPYARLGYLGFAVFIWIHMMSIIRTQEISIPKTVEIPAVACSHTTEMKDHNKQKVLLSLYET